MANIVLMQLDEYRGYKDIDFAMLEEGIERITEQLHFIAMRELMSRELSVVWDWDMRTSHMFEHNHLILVRDVTMLSQGQVNRLSGCGSKTRKEVYDVFCMYHLRLKYWEPKDTNYKF